MSLSTALNSAMSGITAASRQTSVVSDNLANALTEGYYRRTVDLESSVYGGVSVGSVTRVMDPAIQKSVRAAEATYAAANVTSTFSSRVSALIGTVNDDYSLSQRLTDFESALIEATSLPESDARLNDVSMQAEELAVTISETADGISDLRNSSEESIADIVASLNQDLQTIESLNDQILEARISGLDTVALEDQRDNMIDAVNEAIPVQIFQRDNDAIALYTTSGIKLLDGSPAEISFDDKSLITPHMTIDNGLLNGLEIDGVAIDTSINGPIGGGSLAANFHVRDVQAVEAQEDLDVFAGSLIERFQDTTVDTTLGATDPGLFTDNGSFYDPTNITGISNRIALNSTISLSGDAETWRLRDGLNAAGIGETGDTTILNNYVDALEDTVTVSSTGIGSGDYSAYDMASNILNYHTQQVTWGEQELAYASTIFGEMQAQELEQGVDTDAELQTLMMLETIYAANARMLQAVDEMMDQLMGL